MLYKKSGLLGISGISNDMRDLLASNEPAARLAVDYFVYRAAKEIGALAAVLGGIDGLVFTAGIGENSAEIRKRICEASAWLGIELDDDANAREGPRISQPGQQGVGVGDPDQRRTDDRPAHRARCWALSRALASSARADLHEGVHHGCDGHARRRQPTAATRPGRDSSRASGRRRSTSATSSSRTTSRTTATRRSSRRRRRGPQNIWDMLNALFVEERKKGVLDVSQIPSSITAHAPGYIDQDNEIIVGLQTEAPLKRAIMPNGGLRMVLNALKTYGYEPDPHVVEAFTKYRKTHNEARVRRLHRGRPRAAAARTSSPACPTPTAAAASSATTGASRSTASTRLIERKQEEKSGARRGACPPTTSSATARSWPSRSARSRNCSRWRRATASTSRARRRNAREAVQWLYFGYLAGVKEQNGAAMSLGRTSTFLDIYFERDLAAGTLTEEQAQEIIDDFVIKLRIVRFLRTPEYDELFAGDPTWVTESIGGMGDDGRPLVTKTSFRFLQTLYNLGPAPEPNLTIWYSPRLPDGFRRFAAKVAIDTSSLQFESDEIMRRAWGDDGAIACCVSPMLVGKQMQFFGARANLAKCLLYAINGGRDEISGEQVGPAVDAGQGRRTSTSTTCSSKFETMMDWLAGVYVNAMNVIHYMHDKYAYERIEMALHDYAPLRTMAFGMAGMSVVADSLSAIKYAKVRVIRDETGLVTDYQTEGDVPDVRQQRQPRRSARDVGRSARS